MIRLKMVINLCNEIKASMVGKPISGPPNRNDAIYPLEFICRPIATTY